MEREPICLGCRRPLRPRAATAPFCRPCYRSWVDPTTIDLPRGSEEERPDEAAILSRSTAPPAGAKINAGASWHR